MPLWPSCAPGRRNPPVELPPQVVTVGATIDGEQVYRDVCTQCHGTKGEGGLGPALRDPALQAGRSDQQLYDAIFNGHPSTAMIAWGQILSAEQIQQLVAYLRELGAAAGSHHPDAGHHSNTPSGRVPSPAAAPSFATDVLPFLQTPLRGLSRFLGRLGRIQLRCGHDVRRPRPGRGAG